MNSRKYFVTVAIALALGACWTVVTAQSNDHVVVIREAQTLEQIVESELQSSRFAKQIAIYNGLDGISTILPIGASLQIPKPYMESRDFARIAFVKGDVVHSQRNLVVNPPLKGSMVRAGDVISTGEDGFLSLSFNAGATVNLQPESQVSIVNVDCVDEAVRCVISMNADRGSLSSEVTPRPIGQPPVQFTVKTPFLSAAVRGTAFYVNVDSEVDRIGVTRGLVATASNGAKNNLPRGKGLLAVAGLNPTLVDLLPAPELILSEERVIVSDEDFISWNALSGAQQYQYTLASDERLASPISVEQFRATSIHPDLTTPGEYYLAVAGIDSQSFTGLPATSKFYYASIDDHQTLELQVQRIGDTVGVKTADYDSEVELLISNGIDNKNITRKFVDGLSQGLELQLDPDQNWVIQARKVFSDTSVSAYGNQYLLEAVN